MALLSCLSSVRADVIICFSASAFPIQNGRFSEIRASTFSGSSNNQIGILIVLCYLLIYLSVLIYFLYYYADNEHRMFNPHCTSLVLLECIRKYCNAESNGRCFGIKTQVLKVLLIGLLLSVRAVDGLLL